MSAAMPFPTAGSDDGGLNVLLVDDEPLARQRLRTLLADAGDDRFRVVAEAGDAPAALAALRHHRCDVVLLDIHLPGLNGLALAGAMRALSPTPAVVFVTAHAEHAVQAFELEAVDYLTKPVRLERLQAALKKAERLLLSQKALEAKKDQESGSTSGKPVADLAIVIHDRGRTERVPLGEVVYLKAELKYVTVRTPTRQFIYDGSLAEFEERHPGHWLRVHRNALVARHAIRALDKPHGGTDLGDGWVLHLQGVPETLAVSRRQLPAVRDAMGQ